MASFPIRLPQSPHAGVLRVDHEIHSSVVFPAAAGIERQSSAGAGPSPQGCVGAVVMVGATRC